MSGDAKRFRAANGSAGRHGETFWVEEKDNVGLKLLQGMGWSQGQGLGKDGQGRVEAVKQRQKKDNAGIGSNANTRDEAFRASQELFNDVLSRLSGGGADGAPSLAVGNQGTDKLGTAATTVKGVLARNQMSRRFTRARDSGPDKNTAMAEIFGKGGASASKDDAGDNGNERPAELQQTTSNVSVADYFANRRKELGFAGTEPAAKRGGGSSGFTLDDQANFAESQRAAAYGGGRRGLGCGDGGGDDDEAEKQQAPWWRYQQAASPSAAVAGGKKGDKGAKKAAKGDGATKFNWKGAIREALRAVAGGEMKLKKLRTAVLAEHAKATGGAADDEAARKVFKKRLKKLDDVTLTGKMVKLQASK